MEHARYSFVNKVKSAFSFAAAVLSLSACHELEPPYSEQHVQEEESIVVKMNLCCEPLDDEAADSKSMHGTSVLRKISNANYYLFEDGVLVGQKYFDDASDFAVMLPSYSRKYDLYVLANCGRMTVADDLLEVDMAAAVHYDYRTRENYFATIDSYGFPMSVAVRDFSAYSTDDLQLRRLVHTLYVSVDTDELNITDMTFTSLSVRNAARDVYPFSPASKAMYVMDGDAADLDADEIAVLNDGGQVKLYLLENMRGELFPGNTDWKRKVPGLMSASKEEKMKCSYIELTASARTATAYYEHNVYRAYLGTGASDCNVRRHAYSSINNRFTNEMIVDEEWRVEGDTPVVTETLAFVDNLGSTSDIESTKLYPGFKRDFYIYRSNSDIEYVLKGPDASEPPYLNFSITKAGDCYDKVTVTTDAQWQDNDSRTALGTFEIRSKDGLISNTLNCAVLVDPIEVTFSYGPNKNASGFYPSSKPKLRMKMTNYLKLGFDVSINGTCGAYIFYYPNGTWGKMHEDSFLRSFDMGTIDRIYPETGHETVIDEYLNCTTVKNNPGSGLYDMFSYDIWSFKKEDSYNKIGSSNSYMKHFQPTRLSLDIKLKYGPSEDGLLYPEDEKTVLPIIVTNDDSSTLISGITYFRAGTDFGIYWNQIDNTDTGEIRRIEYTEYFTFNTAGSILVYVNGTGRWSNGVSVSQ